MITIRPIRPSDINAIVSLSNRRLWQRHTGFDEWHTDPLKKSTTQPWEKLSLYQRYLNSGVWNDPVLYKNHLNWLTKNGGFSIAAEESDGIMKRLVAFTEVWCAEEPSPMGKTGSVILLEVDTHFVEDPISKLYTQVKKDIRSRGFSTLAICPFSSKAVSANLDDRRWELLALVRHYRVPRAQLTPCELTHRVEEVPRAELPLNEFYCHDQSIPPHYYWASIWEEFDVIPEMKGAIRRGQVRKIHLEYHGENLQAVIWCWVMNDSEDFRRLHIWVPPGKEDDRELLYELVRIAGEIWNGEDVPGFVLCADEDNGSYLINRGFTAEENRPAEPRYYTGV